MNAPSEDIIKKEIYLYQILNKVDGKFYLGTTCDIDRRWKEHKRSLSQGTHHSIYLQRAWNKGLSKETDERIAKSANSKEIRLKRSIAVKEWWKHKKQKQNECA